MDSRERTFIALEHKEPDRVPIDCWISGGTKRKIETKMNLSYQEFLDRYDVDLRYIEGPQYIGPVLESSDGLETDIWGVPRKRQQVSINDSSGEYCEVYKEVIESPLKTLRTVDEINNYSHWPSPDWFDYSVIESQCDEIYNQGRVVVFIGDRLNRFAQLKPAMYVRGTEEIFLDMTMAPEVAVAIFNKISSFYLEYERRILEAAKGKIDILCTGDDFGAQNNLMISPAMWKEFLEKGFRDYIKLGQSYSAKVMHHTCGSVYKIMQDMIRCGLDIVQSIQPEADGMDPSIIKREFGNQVSFQGGISIQKILPFGSKKEVKAHVRTTFEKMKPGGGYIASTSHNIQADTSIENIETLFEAYHLYGRY